MSYRAGINFGAVHTDPIIVCDNCGTHRSVTTRRGIPAVWFLNLKAAPGWSLERKVTDDGQLFRRDLCPECREDRR